LSRARFNEFVMLPHKLKTSLAGPGRTRRYLALVLLCLCLVGQLSGFTHFLTVQHGVCPEHGEVVHGPHQTGQTGQTPDAALAPVLALEGLLSAVQKTSTPAAEHEHEHCLLLSERRGQAVPEQALRPLRAAPLGTAPPLIAVEPRHDRCIALLRLAPKNSPPA
jgi:hypothetical protein